ncbi:deoxynucleoside kinase [Candidatus Babeliales bacterium]|nr:deoxynucleoside kinase [Candidatus Babeliales bacterium]
MQKCRLFSLALLSLYCTTYPTTQEEAAPTIVIREPLQIMVEGNIGAGKTTFLRMLSEALQDVSFLPEPVESWQNVNGYNLLQELYTDSNRWAYSFQTYAFLTHIKNQEHATDQDAPVALLERSIYSCYFCFARNFKETNQLNPLEWELCNELFKKHVADAPKPDGFIYLKTSPEICFTRLKMRNRSEEAGVPLEYLEKLSFNHDDWLIRKNGITPREYKEIPVLVLDRDLDIFDPAVFAEYVHQVKAFITDLESCN